MEAHSLVHGVAELPEAARKLPEAATSSPTSAPRSDADLEWDLPGLLPSASPRLPMPPSPPGLPSAAGAVSQHASDSVAWDSNPAFNSTGATPGSSTASLPRRVSQVPAAAVHQSPGEEGLAGLSGASSPIPLPPMPPDRHRALPPGFSSIGGNHSEIQPDGSSPALLPHPGGSGPSLMTLDLPPMEEAGEHSLGEPFWRLQSPHSPAASSSAATMIIHASPSGTHHHTPESWDNSAFTAASPRESYLSEQRSSMDGTGRSGRTEPGISFGGFAPPDPGTWSGGGHHPLSLRQPIRRLDMGGSGPSLTLPHASPLTSRPSVVEEGTPSFSAAIDPLGASLKSFGSLRHQIVQRSSSVSMTGALEATHQSSSLLPPSSRLQRSTVHHRRGSSLDHLPSSRQLGLLPSSEQQLPLAPSVAGSSISPVFRLGSVASALLAAKEWTRPAREVWVWGAEGQGGRCGGGGVRAAKVWGWRLFGGRRERGLLVKRGVNRQTL